MKYNRQTAIDAIARLTERHNAKKDVELKSFQEEESNKRVHVSPVYLKPYGVCNDNVTVTYQDVEYVVLRSSLSASHQAKIPVGRWGNINVKLSTLTTV